jgi:hypothetical protein
MDRLIPTTLWSFIGGFVGATVWDTADKTACSWSTVVPIECVDIGGLQISDGGVFVLVGTAVGFGVGVLLPWARWWRDKLRSK